mmetsp:Transcript_21972/g.62395  ORF Transcript_21972/g.62395 Transcript_21972/m.62395 type:complete len:212 (-) Transcript_21972:34-669(-)
MVKLILENHLEKYRVVDTRRSSEDDAALRERLGHTSHKMFQITATPLVQTLFRHVLDAPRSPGEKIPEGAFYHNHVWELLSLHVHDAHDRFAQFLATGHVAMFYNGIGVVPERRLEITMNAHSRVSGIAHGEIPFLVYATQSVKFLTVGFTEIRHCVPVHRRSQKEDRVGGTTLHREPTRHGNAGRQTARADHRCKMNELKDCCMYWKLVY